MAVMIIIVQLNQYKFKSIKHISMNENKESEFDNIQQDQGIQIPNPTVLDAQKQLINIKPSKTLPFEVIIKFFNKMSMVRGVKKGIQTKQFFKALFKISRQPLFVYSILRIVLPSDDRHRGNYGLKQKGLAKIISDTLGLKKQDYQRLYHYKNPSYHQRGFAIGDFSLCVYDIATNFCKLKSQVSIYDINTLLDQLVISNANYNNVFTQLFQKCNAQEIKWLIRIILKDLKLSIKIQSVLKCYHKDAYDYFNLTNNLLQVCKKFQNQSVSLNDEICLFNPINPMLAGKKNITYFKYNQKQLFIETKYDGQRIQTHWNKGEIKLFSRNGVNYTHIYKQIVEVLTKTILADSCILDGQIIVLTNTTNQMVPFGMNKVVALSNNDNNMHLCYKIFDILWVSSDDQQVNLMKFTLDQRKKILQNSIKTIPNVIQIVKHKVLSKYDDILQQFSDSIDRNQQGIMLKDPSSIYSPKQRGVNWLKLKGDYIDGLTDTLDLLVLGGYFGDKSYRQGNTGHWIDKVTTFLLGVIRKTQYGFTAIPFCKVGTGYSAHQLTLLRQKIKNNLFINDTKVFPKNIQNWRYNIQDKPDCWINSIENSLVIEVKAAEIINSDSYPTQCTLRFPRVVKVRYDKDPDEALTLRELDQMKNSQKYSKNMKKIGESSDQQDDQKNPNKHDSLAKKKTKINGRQRVDKNVVLSDFQGVQLTDMDLKKSNTFFGMSFVVLNLQDSNYSRHEVERQILLNGGQVTQNPMPTTKYIIADHIDYRLNTYLKLRSRINFLKPKYIFQCTKQKTLIPLSPLYFICLPPQKRDFFLQSYDRFSDSYTEYLNQKQLNIILEEMNNKQKFPINKNLIEMIQIQRRRKGWKVYCVGISRLQKVKLKMHGTIIIERLETNIQIDSIIIGKPLLPYQQRQIDAYLKYHQRTSVQNRSILQSQNLI